MTPSRRKWLVFAAKFALTIVLLAFLLRHEGSGAGLLARMTSVAPVVVIAVVVLMLCQAGLNAVRWQLITRLVGRELRLGLALRYVLIGLFFNQTLPSTLGGDVVRWWYAHREGIPALSAFNGLLLDRLIGMLMLALVTMAMVPVVGGELSRFAPPSFLLAMLVAMGVGFLSMLLVDRLPPAFTRWRVLQVGVRLAADARSVFLHKGSTPWLLLLSFVAQVFLVVAVYLLAGALGLTISFAVCLCVVPAALLFAALPVSIGGWGVRESAFVLGFGLFGVGATDAFALSVLFGVASLLAGLPGGLLWWFNRRQDDTPAPNDVSLEAVLESETRPGK